MALTETQKERFFSKVQKKSKSECWEWKGHRFKKDFNGGYGVFEIYCSISVRNRKRFQAHRLAYELEFGIDPEGLNVCHICDNPGCCNPNHLFLGTHADNMIDMKIKNRSRMLRGEYRGERSGMSKLKEADVIEIRIRLKNKQTQQSIAKLYNVTQGLIHQIKANKIWNHLA